MIARMNLRENFVLVHGFRHLGYPVGYGMTEFLVVKLCGGSHSP